MKKTIITLALVLMSIGTFAQGGLFQYGAVSDEEYYGAGNRTGEGLLELNLPNGHGETTDTPATPLGSGALLLIGFGAAYALKKQRKR